MAHLSIPIWEFVFRGAVVYIFLLVLLRLTGKRQVGQLATFDLVLLLILSNAVQNSMNGGDNSLIGGLISALGRRQAPAKPSRCSWRVDLRCWSTTAGFMAMCSGVRS
jgi:hypothetical protein